MEEKKGKHQTGGQKYNSMSHGLTSKVLLTKMVSVKESKEIYDSILEGFRESFHPQNFFEETLLERMALAQIKFWRYEQLEAESFKEFHDLEDNSVRYNLTASFNDSLLKYKGSNESQFYKAVRYFIDIKLNAKGND